NILLLSKKLSNVELTVLDTEVSNWSLSSLINLLDYHQRVPTQIDRFILLKSLLFEKFFSQSGGAF
ncbi:hypothetical protein, partial [Vibrio vulnificus]|uniref:hypothetical protein n=2 Tax=Vibrio vulnificus TaxID=672 RepID=UPI0009B61890